MGNETNRKFHLAKCSCPRYHRSNQNIRSHVGQTPEGLPCVMVFRLTACTACERVVPVNDGSVEAKKDTAEFFRKHRNCAAKDVTEPSVTAFIDRMEAKHKEVQASEVAITTLVARMKAAQPPAPQAALRPSPFVTIPNQKEVSEAIAAISAPQPQPLEKVGELATAGSSTSFGPWIAPGPAKPLLAPSATKLISDIDDSLSESDAEAQPVAGPSSAIATVAAPPTVSVLLRTEPPRLALSSDSDPGVFDKQISQTKRKKKMPAKADGPKKPRQTAAKPRAKAAPKAGIKQQNEEWCVDLDAKAVNLNHTIQELKDRLQSVQTSKDHVLAALKVEQSKNFKFLDLEQQLADAQVKNRRLEKEVMRKEENMRAERDAAYKELQAVQNDLSRAKHEVLMKATFMAEAQRSFKEELLAKESKIKELSSQLDAKSTGSEHEARSSIVHLPYLKTQLLHTNISIQEHNEVHECLSMQHRRVHCDHLQIVHKGDVRIRGIKLVKRKFTEESQAVLDNYRTDAET